MAFHTSPTATFVTPVQPDQPPSGTAAWLREMARGSNSVAEQQARIVGDQHLQDEIDGITSSTGVLYALVNAVRELSAKVAALEARLA